MLLENLFVVALLTYGAATTASLLFFLTERREIRKAARLLLPAAGLLHSLSLAGRFIATGHSPVSTDHEALSFFAWSMTWAFLSFRWRYQVKNFGAFVSPLIFVLMLAAFYSSQEIRPLSPMLQSLWLPVHASLALAANAFYALAACGGLMYLLQERELKKKHFGFFFSRLPSLDSLDHLNYHCLALGFLLMTLGMVTGALWSRQVWGAYWHWEPKQTWTLITWLLYAALMHQRFTVGWRGRRSALLTVAAFFLVLFSFWGINTFFSGMHNVG